MTDPHLPGDPLSQDEEMLAAQQRMAAVRELRRFVTRHNWQALVLSFFSLAVATALWGLVYLLVYWFSLIFITVARSFDPDTLLEINDPQLISARFPWWFLGGGLAVLIVAGLVRRKLRTDSLREARHYFLWVMAELLLAIPNVTFSVWGNLSALVRLPRSEATDAWRLLERVNHEGGRLNAASLRLEINDERRLQHVLFVLQIVGLVDLREKKDGWFLCLQNRDAFALLNSAGTVD